MSIDDNNAINISNNINNYDSNNNNYNNSNYRNNNNTSNNYNNNNSYGNNNTHNTTKRYQQQTILPTQEIGIDPYPKNILPPRNILPQYAGFVPGGPPHFVPPPPFPFPVHGQQTHGQQTHGQQTHAQQTPPTQQHPQLLEYFARLNSTQNNEKMAYTDSENTDIQGRRNFKRPHD